MNRNHRRSFMALALVAVSVVPADAHWYLSFIGSGSSSSPMPTNVATETFEDCAALGRLQSRKMKELYEAEGYEQGATKSIEWFCYPSPAELTKELLKEK